MTYSEIITDDNLVIVGIKEQFIYTYFLTINREEFQQTATLFAEDGELLAPFEELIIGRKAIALYLSKEAKGMTLLPQQGIYEFSENDSELIKVLGKVKTSLFTVNLAWFFNYNSQQQITTARIKLLASPQELLGLRKVVSNYKLLPSAYY
ncbi:MAG: nuclear transport factor 2 family protein [Xenococcaceae cyanobacterium]